ncbi:MAG: flagellar basal body-associated FliL family protein [Magnetococcales bacterium]|nr:flagellar basal body-associated FliL family protein [Magnetococcales bacterium]
MAEDVEQQEGEPSGGGGSGGIVKILILVVPALLIGLGGGFFVGKKVADKKAVETEVKDPHAKEETDKKNPAELVGEMVKLEPFVVNLNEPRGNRYLKTTIQLELEGPALKEELTRRAPQVQDIVLALLTSKTTQELQSLEGKFRLREELLSRINALLVNGSIKRVYFTEFVIQ